MSPSVIISVHVTQWLEHLERLQKRALRIIYSNVSYDEALALAKLSTLKCIDACLFVRNDSMKFQLAGHISSIIYSHL